MSPGDDVMFYNTLRNKKLTEGTLKGRSSLRDQEGNRVFWSVEYGKKVKKTIIIHESQIEGLR